LWKPSTFGELFDAYRDTWALLVGRLDELDKDEREKALGTLLRRSRSLAQIRALSNMVFDTFDALADKTYLDRNDLLVKVIEILRYDGPDMEHKLRSRWEGLHDKLAGTDFSSSLRRYVGLGLLEDHYDRDGEPVDEGHARIVELAEQAVRDSSLLLPELQWLVTAQAQNGYSFGYELARADGGFELLPRILEAQENVGQEAGLGFISGYFSMIFETDPNIWEEKLEIAAKASRLRPAIPELTCRSGMSDRAGKRILHLVTSGAAAKSTLWCLRLNQNATRLSEGTFSPILDLLVRDSEAETLSVALVLHRCYYVRDNSRRPMPEDVTLSLLTHEGFFSASESQKRHYMDGYYWAEIAEEFVKDYPERGTDLADIMLRNFRQDGSILDTHPSPPIRVLGELTREHPEQVWELVTQYLGPPMDTRAWDITQWLRAGEDLGNGHGMLDLIPAELIWQWVNQDEEQRAPYLATFVPKELTQEEGKVCLARELLVRYGHQANVRRRLMMNFSTEFFSGPSSLHFRRTKARLLDFKRHEDDPNVRQWVDDYVADLDSRIERAEIVEEREDL
jgi:hypothetical protein